MSISFFPIVKLRYKLLLIAAIVAAIIFLVPIVLIVNKFETEDVKNTRPKYIVILGAKVKNEGPSPTLQRRLDAAIQLLHRDSGLIAVVSGGKGTDEPTSEASAMALYLLQKGIKPARIIEEDQSQNTVENLRFSRNKIGQGKNKIVPIYLSTSNYHQYRAQIIAEEEGFDPYGIPCSTPFKDLPIYLIRESLALLKHRVM